MPCSRLRALRHTTALLFATMFYVGCAPAETVSNGGHGGTTGGAGAAAGQAGSSGAAGGTGTAGATVRVG
jgi:hypothetical protein